MNKENQEIQAIGRTLSEINILRIRRIHQLAEQVLDSAGVINTPAYTNVTELKVEAQAEAEEDSKDFTENSLENSAKDSTEDLVEPLDFSEEGKSIEVGSLEETLNSPAEIQSGEIEIKCRGMWEEESAQVESNRHPIRGVLFKIDTPSECAPSIGTGHPLYVPRKVAEEALKNIEGLPLDADDSLSNHANDQIVGVMVGAEIVGNDFVVKGHLWPYNNQKKVNLIRARQGELGMSMNAYASGHLVVVDGREVFWINKLELLGANILFGAKATYKTTSFAASAEQDDDAQSDVAIAASGETHNSQEENNMEDAKLVEEIASQFKDIQSGVRNTFDELSSQLKEVTEVIQCQQEELAEIQAERQEIQAAQNKEKTEAQKQEERQEFLTLIQTAVDEAISQKFNPSGQPRRFTSRPKTSIAASESFSPERIELEKKIARLEGQLSSERDLTHQLKLTDELRALKEQLTVI